MGHYGGGGSMRAQTLKIYCARTFLYEYFAFKVWGITLQFCLPPPPCMKNILAYATAIDTSSAEVKL